MPSPTLRWDKFELWVRRQRREISRIWYHYATGYKPALNKSINETLAKKGALSDADLEQTYDTYIATSHIGERIDSLGSRVLDEVKQVLDMVNVAAGSATNYSETLADASQKLEHAKDGDALRAVIECLVQGAKEMELNNKKLETRLAASKQEIEQLQQNLETVRTESLTDPLTSLSNRKFFGSALARNIAVAKEKNQPLSLLMARHRPFQALQRQIRTPHRGSGAAPRRAVGEAERH